MGVGQFNETLYCGTRLNYTYRCTEHILRSYQQTELLTLSHRPSLFVHLPKRSGNKINELYITYEHLQRIKWPPKLNRCSSKLLFFYLSMSWCNSITSPWTTYPGGQLSLDNFLFPLDNLPRGGGGQLSLDNFLFPLDNFYCWEITSSNTNK